MSSEAEKTVSNEKGDGRKKLLVGIVIAVIAVLIVSVISLASLLIKSNNKSDGAAENKERKSVITADNVEEVLAEMTEYAQPTNIPQSFTVMQSIDWVFSGENAESLNAVVTNDPTNETPVYFDLIIDETGEVVYSSPVLELGAELRGFKLDKKVDPGSYECTVLYHLVDEDQKELTTVNVGVNITVGQ